MVRLGAIGDVARTLPAVSALRAAYPAAHLGWLVEPASEALLRGQPWVDEVLVFPRESLRRALRGARPARALREARAFAAGLRARRFELVLDFHGILKSGILSRLSGAPRRVAYARPFAREGSWLFATDRARLGPARASRFERNEALVRFLGVAQPAAPRPLRVPQPVADEMAAALPGPPPVALHPGSSPTTPHKRLAPEAYAAVARGLGERGLEVRVAAGPSAAEQGAARAVVEASAGRARLAPPTPTLSHLAGLFARCRVVVGSDSGPVHLASLVGTPVVQLVGPTDPVENRPYPGTPSRQLRVPVACAPCRRGCDAALCMRLLRSEAVVEAAAALAGGRDG